MGRILPNLSLSASLLVSGCSANFKVKTQLTSLGEGDFVIIADGSPTNDPSPEVSWGKHAEAVSYHLHVATTDSCADPMFYFAELTETSRKLDSLDDGIFFLCVFAKKSDGSLIAAGNNGFKITLDRTPPEIALPDDVAKNAAFEPEVSVHDFTEVTYLWEKIAGMGDAQFSDDKILKPSISFDSEGWYTIRLVVTDAAGNVSSKDLSVKWDLTAPSIDLGPDIVIGSSTKISHTYPDDVVTFQWEVMTQEPGGGLTWDSMTIAEPTISASKNGIYAIKLTATDAAGNVASDTLGITWNISNIVFTSIDLINDAADTYINAAEQSSTNDLVGNLAGADYTQIEYKLVPSGTLCAAVTSWLGTVPQSNASEFVSDGDYKVCVKLSDNLGSTPAYGASAIIHRDTLVPVFTSLALANEASDGFVSGAEAAATSALAASLVALNHDSVEYKLEPAVNACSTATGWLSSIPKVDDAGFNTDGTYKVCVKLTDAAGNPPAYGASTNITRDTTAPAFSSLVGANEASDNVVDMLEVGATNPIAALTASGANGSTKYTNILDDSGGVTCDNTRVYSNSSIPLISSVPATDGVYALCVELTDTAGNVTYGKSSQFTRDTVPPVATISGQPTATNNTTALNVTVAGTNIAAYKYKVGLGGLDCSSSGGYSAETPIGTKITSDISGLADGAIRLCVIGKSVYGYWQQESVATVANWTKDTTAPIAAVNGQPIGESRETTLAIVVSGADVTTYRYALGNASLDCGIAGNYGSTTPVATQISDDISAQADGGLKLCVVGIDGVGNVQSYAAATTVSWTKDTVAPTATISGAPSGNNNTTILNVNIGGAGVTHYQYKVAETASVDCAAAAGYSADVLEATNITTDISGLADGSITLCVVGKDAAGNLAPYSSAVTAVWSKDTSAPTATLSGQPVASDSATSLNINVGGTDITHYKYKVGEAAAIDCNVATGYSGTEISEATNISDDISALSDGSITLCVIGKNSVGTWQLESAATQVSWAKDTVIPTVTINPTIINNTNKSNVTVSGTCSENGRLIAIGGAVVTTATCSAGTWSKIINYSTEADGGVSVTADHDDAAGNDATQAATTFTKDTVIPTVTINTAVINNTNKSAVPVSGTCSENTRTVTIGGAVAGSATCSGGAWSTTIDYSGQADGAVAVTADHNDAAGNSAVQASTSFTKDTGVPTVTINPPGYINIANQSATPLSGTCSENGRTVTVGGAVSGSAVCNAGAWSTNINYSGESDGSVSVTADLNDAAGNGAIQASASFTKDTVAPTVSFNGLVINDSNKAAAPMSGNCSENGRTVTIGGARSGSATCTAGSWSTTIDYSGVSDGNVAATADTTDAAGNPAIQDSGFLFKDTTAPTVTIDAVVINSVNQAAVPVTGTCSENTRTVTIGGAKSGSGTCSGGTWSATIDYSSEADGNVAITADHSDASGNAATQAATNLTKDTVPPAASATNVPTGSNGQVMMDITVTGAGVTHYKYDIGVSSIDCSSTTYSSEFAVAAKITENISGLAEGGIKLCVIGRDAAGNYQTNASAAAYTWTKDTSVDDPASFNLNAWDGSVNLAWTSGGTQTGFILVRRAGSAVTWTPTENTNYSVGDLDGGTHQLVYKGTSLLFSDTGLTNGTTYHYRLYAYNNWFNYSNPLIGSSTPMDTGYRYYRFVPTSTYGNCSVSYLDDLRLHWGGSVKTNSGFDADSVGTIGGLAATISTNSQQATFDHFYAMDSRLNYSGLFWKTTNYFNGSSPYDLTNPSSFPWLKIDFGASTRISVTGLQLYEDHACRVDAFYLEGSNDDTTWYEIIGSRHVSVDIATTPTVTWTWSGSTENPLLAPPVSFDVTSGDGELDMSWSGTGNETGFILVRRKDAEVDWAPSSGSTYTVNTTIGNNKILYIGSGTSYTDTEILDGEVFYYKVFAYNGSNIYSSGLSDSAYAQDPNGFRYYRFIPESLEGLCNDVRVEYLEFQFEGAFQTGNGFNLNGDYIGDFGYLKQVTASADSQTSSSVGGNYAFADNTTYWQSNSGKYSYTNTYTDAPNLSDTSWLKVDLGANRKIAISGMKVRGDSVCYPDTFYLQGSDDNASWVDILGSRQAGQNTSTTQTYTWSWAGTSANPVHATPTAFSATTGNSQLALAWTGAGSDAGFVLVRRKLKDPDFAPVSGTVYTAGQTFQDNEVLYVGTNTSYTDTAIKNGETYYYRVFAYNGSNIYSQGIAASGTAEDPNGFRYYRFIPTSLNNDACNNVRVEYLELQFEGSFQASTGFNLNGDYVGDLGYLKQVTVSADSETSASYGGNYAFVDNTVYWQSSLNKYSYTNNIYNDAMNLNDTSWLKVDLGTGRKIYVSGMKVRGDALCYPDTFYLQASNDNTTWTEILGSRRAGVNTATTQTYTWAYAGTVANPVHAKPTTFAATNGTSEVTLNWSGAGGDSGFVLVRRKKKDPDFAPVAGTAYAGGESFGDNQVLYVGTNTSYVDSEISMGETYYYRLYAINGSNIYSEGVSASGTAEHPNGFRYYRFVPTELTGTCSNDVGLQYFELSWENTFRTNSSISGSGTSATGNFGIIPVSVSADSYDSVSYHHLWEGLSDNASEWSSTGNYFDQGVPNIPANPANHPWIKVTFPVKMAVDGVKLRSVNSCYNPASFHLEASNDDSNWYQVLGSQFTGTSSTTTSTYSWNWAGATSNPSLAAPASLTPTPGDSQVALSWDGVGGATGYVVTRRPTGYPRWTPKSGTTYTAGNMFGETKVVYVGASTSATDLTVINDTNYTYEAFAHNGSVYSGWVSATATPSSSVKFRYYRFVPESVWTNSGQDVKIEHLGFRWGGSFKTNTFASGAAATGTIGSLSVTVSESSFASASYKAAEALTDNSTAWTSNLNLFSATYPYDLINPVNFEWVKVDFGANPVAIDGLRLEGDATCDCGPDKWRLEGSNDDTNWSTILGSPATITVNPETRQTFTWTWSGSEAEPIQAAPASLSALAFHKRIDLSWSAASGAPTGYIVLRNPNNDIDTAPVSGTTYTQGQMLGNNEVIYVGTSLSYSDTASVDGATNYYAVYAYDSSTRYSPARKASAVGQNSDGYRYYRMMLLSATNNTGSERFLIEDIQFRIAGTWLINRSTANATGAIGSINVVHSAATNLTDAFRTNNDDNLITYRWDPASMTRYQTSVPFDLVDVVNNPEWLKWDFGARVAITGMTIKQYGLHATTLDEFVLQGSNDDASWEEINHTRTFIAGAQSTHTWTFDKDAKAIVHNPPTGNYNRNTLVLDVMGAEVTDYRYKIGIDADCANSSGYSADTAINVDINEDIASLGLGNMVICVVGKRGGVWQSYANATSYSFTRVERPKFKHVAVGDDSTCALSYGGKIFCWGENEWSSQQGLLGTGSVATDIYYPEEVDTIGMTGSKEFIQFDHSSYAHTCGVTADGTGYCWGAPGGGRLGNNDASTIRTAPSLIDTTDMTGSKKFRKIRTGRFHSCGLATDGILYCWGEDAQGELGDSISMTNKYRPQPVNTSNIANFRGWLDFALNYANTCAITTDGKAYCWGDDAAGELGNDNAAGADQPLPVAVDTTNLTDELAFVKIEAQSGAGFCAITGQGKGACWGYNGWYEFSAGSTSYFYRPVQMDLTAITGDESIKGIGVGNGFVCELTTDGKVYCQGQGFGSRLGTGNTSDQNNPTPIDETYLPSNTRFVRLAVGYDSACAIAADGDLYCWGRMNTDLGRGQYVSNQSSPKRVMTDALVGSKEYQQVVAGRENTCILDGAGQVFCFGSDLNGQLGDGGVNTRQDAPVPLDLTNVTPVKQFIKLAMGYNSACGLTADGKGWCWGSDSLGALGNAGTTTTEQARPIAINHAPIVGAESLIDITIGYQHACAISGEGKAYCWGNDSDGQLGTGGVAHNEDQPTAVDTSPFTGEKAVRSIKSFETNTCLILAEGSTWCAGDGNNGKIGNNDTQDQQQFTAVATTNLATNERFLDISGSLGNVCALATTGKVWCWGDSAYNILGTGAVTDYNLPTAAVDTINIAGQKQFKGLTVNTYNACGVMADGVSYCWGSTTSGVDGGSGTPVKPTTPIDTSAMAGDTLAQCVSETAYQTRCLISGKGLPYCWGSDGYGQTGSNTVASSINRPTVIDLQGVDPN